MCCCRAQAAVSGEVKDGHDYDGGRLAVDAVTGTAASGGAPSLKAFALARQGPSTIVHKAQGQLDSARPRRMISREAPANRTRERAKSRFYTSPLETPKSSRRSPGSPGRVGARDEWRKAVQERVDVAGLALVGDQGLEDSEVGGRDLVGERDGPVVVGIVWEEVSGMGGQRGGQQRGRVGVVGAVGVQCGCGPGEELADVDDDLGAI
jgi:hypothetical protein